MTVRELISNQIIAEDAQVHIKRLPGEESAPYDLKSDINYIDLQVWGEFRVVLFQYYPEGKLLIIKVVEPEKINNWMNLLWPPKKKKVLCSERRDEQ